MPVNVENILRLMLVARTSSECAVAWQAAHAWIREHPRDEPLIIAAGSRLAVVQEALHVVDHEARRSEPEVQGDEPPT